MQGMATYYAPGLMREVAEYRGMDAPLLVALNRKGDLGRTVWVRKGGVVYEALVVDCAQEGHFADREVQGRVLEVPYWLAMEWGMRGPVPVSVHFRRPPERLVPQ